MDTPKRDAFLCHASEDEDSIVRPLYKAFTDAGISCWQEGLSLSGPADAPGNTAADHTHASGP